MIRQHHDNLSDHKNHVSRGFSLIEMMVALGVMGIMTLTYLALMSQGMGAQRSMQIKTSLLNLRNQIDSAIRNQQTWYSPGGGVDSTVEVNFDLPPAPSDPNFQSLIDSTVMSPLVTSSGYPVLVLLGIPGIYTLDFMGNSNVLIDQNPNNTTSGTPATRGFDTNGNKCINFGDPAGTCVFQYRIFWSPICTSGTQCLSPGVQYSAQLTINTNAIVLKGISINPASYQISWTTRNDPNYLANFCNQLLGTWNGTTCTFTSAVCPNPNQRLMGIQVTGVPPNQQVSPQCVDMFSGADNTTCPAGEKFVRINADGTKLCDRNLAGSTRPNCGVGEKMIALDDKGNYSCYATLTDIGDCPNGQKAVGVDSQGRRRCRPSLDFIRSGACGPGTKQNGNDANGDPICVAILERSCDPGYQMTGIDLTSGLPTCTRTGSVCPTSWLTTGYDGEGNPICEKDTQHSWNANLAGPCNNCDRTLGSASCSVEWAGEQTTVTDIWFSYPAQCSGIRGFNATCYAFFGAAGSFCSLRKIGPSGVAADCHVDQFYFGNPAIDTGGEFTCHHRFIYY